MVLGMAGIISPDEEEATPAGEGGGRGGGGRDKNERDLPPGMHNVEGKGRATLWYIQISRSLPRL